MASTESDGTKVNFQGVCKIKQHNYSVTLTESDLSWQAVHSKKDDLKTVRVAEILAAKMNTSQNKDVLCIVFAQLQKNMILKRCVVEFSADDTNCLEQLNNQLTQLITNNDGRPKSLLVIVNPLSGRTKGMSVYTKTVAPIFQEAGIHTDVIVTERAHHTEEILATYDLNSINGLIVVGGDGTYHEAVNGMLRRLTKEQGINVDDVELDVPDIGIPIGIIPCGTGNGIASGLYGNYDVQTAALSIVIGFRDKSNIFSVHCAGRLVSYSVLLVGSGMWGDIIHVAESRRSQGIMRYPITMGEFAFFRRFREFPVTIQYKGVDKGTGDMSSPEGVSEDSGAENSFGWTTSKNTIIGSFLFPADLTSMGSLDGSFDGNSASMLVSKPCSKMAVAKFFVKMAQKKIDMSRPELSELAGLEWKMSLDNPSDPESKTGIYEHNVNIDGEPFTLSKPDYHCKLLRKKVTLFSNMPHATGRSVIGK